MDPIGVGIIGAGYWGRKLAAEYLDAERSGRIRLVKVCDNSIASLGTLLINHETTAIGHQRLTLDTQDIIENPEISAVHIATLYETHNVLARMALEAGKSVLVETPISISKSECHGLVDLAAEKRLVIEDGHYCRFNRALQVAGEMVRRGDLGRVFYVRVQWADPSSLVDREIIFDLGNDPVDILNLLLGTWPKEVGGVAGAYRNSEHNELAHIFAEYPDNVFAHIELSWLHPRRIREVFIVGSQATLDVNVTDQRVIQRSAGKSMEIPVTASNTIASAIDHFVDKILGGDFTVDPAVIRTVETLEAIQSSLWRRVPAVTRLEKSPESNQKELPSLETAAGLLEIVHKGTNNTPIINQGELNPDLVHRYFVMLEKIGLVEGRNRPNQEKAFSITTKGLQFLTDYYESQRLGEITDNTKRVLEAVGLGTSQTQ